MPTLTFEITQGDTFPPIGGTLIDADEQLVTVQAGDTVRFRMTPVIEGLRADIDRLATAAPGSADVFYAWAPGDTDTPGVYDAEFHLSRPGGLEETFPNGEFIRVVIKAKAAARA